jgi:MFS family permease
MDDLGMDTIAYGYVNSAFQFAYAIGFLAMGKYIDRVGTRTATRWRSFSGALPPASMPWPVPPFR